MKIIDAGVELWPVPATREERLALIERAGRVCYKSEDRIADGTAEKFISNLIQRGHTSVLEHGNIVLRTDASTLRWIEDAKLWLARKGRNVYLRVGCHINRPNGNVFLVSGNARAWIEFLKAIELSFLAHEITDDVISVILNNRVLFDGLDPEKHMRRISKYYKDSILDGEMFDLSFVNPGIRAIHQTYTLKFTCDRATSHELVRHRVMSFSQESTRYCNYGKDKFGNEITVIRPFYAQEGALLYEPWMEGMQNAERAYFKMLNAGATAQEARSVLPNDLKTEVVVTGTCNDWLHFLKLRTSNAAHPCIRRLALKAAELLYNEQPEIFSQYAERR